MEVVFRKVGMNLLVHNAQMAVQFVTQQIVLNAPLSFYFMDHFVSLAGVHANNAKIIPIIDVQSVLILMFSII